MSQRLPDSVDECATLVEFLRWRVSHQPDAMVYAFLVDGETEEATLTYRELDRRARAIGAQLQQLGAAGERALLLYPPGLEYIAAFWGCLYAGIIAVPAYPPDPTQLSRTLPRLKAIANDAQPLVALTTSPVLSLAGALFGEDADFQKMRWMATDTISDDVEWRGPDVYGDTIAFLQYTSGSTATPKGVMLTHRNLLHNLALIHECFEITSRSRGVIWLPPYHDMGLIGGILEPLYSGVSTILISPVDFLKRPFRWLQAISRYKVNTSGGPNFAYDLCVRKITPEQRATLDLSSWEVAFNGAEPIRPETLERFAETFAPCGFRKEAFYTCYGLAEATLIVTGSDKAALPVTCAVNRATLGQNRIEPVPPTHSEAQVLVGCGHARPSERVVIVNPDTLRQCAPDQVGEIWVSGPGMAQGYWQRPEETAYTFRAHLADTGQGPFMRTGDLGFLKEGELFVTGRLKDLIIIRGRNHYPQDIELTVEKSHPSLRPGCSAAFSVEVAGEERLVVVQEVNRQAVDLNTDEVIETIRQAVAEQHELQAYGVMLLPPGSMPKTSSGKVQRHACRAGFLADTLETVAKSILEIPAEEAPPSRPEVSFIREALSSVQEPAARRSLLALYLQEQAARVLHLTRSQVSPQKPISALGLDSLMAIELKHEIETSLGVVLPMADVLQGPSIARLADEILAQFSDTVPAPDVTLTSVSQPLTEYPLSSGQQSLWFLYQLAPDSAAYNVPSAVRIRSPLDVAALERAFQKLMERHPSLRTTFTILAEGPVQRIHDQMPLDFQAVDASAWSEATLDERLAQEAHRPFDLEKGPLVRVHVFKRSEQEHVLLVVMHHIVTDFWSLAVLVEELSVLYPAECTGRPAVLPRLYLQYSDYVRWQTEMLAGPNGKPLRSFWLSQLAGELPVLNLPTDYPRPSVQTYRGDVYTLRLGAGLTDRLKALSQANEATLNMTLLAAFQALLFRYTGQEDLLVGSLAAGRSRADLAGIVGYFVNPIVLRSRPHARLKFAALLQETRQTLLGAFEHQEYPFNVLVDQLQPVRDYSRSPLFQVMFVFQRAYKFNEQGLTPFGLDISGAQIELAGLRLESLALEHRVAQFDLTLTMGQADGGLIASFEYNTDLFERATVMRMAAHLQRLLEGCVADLQRCLADLPLMSDAELQQLLVEWNGMRTELGHGATIQALFEAQAARTPEALAVIHESQRFTYRELNERASQLAACLRKMGVGPEQVVGICVERSPEMIVGILGVLKAGGAYLPLDPAYPQDRLAFMLAETQAPVLLTQAHLQAGLSRRTSRVICLDQDWETILAEARTGAQSSCSEAAAANLACVIYTSGSTGQPKGVLLEHRGIVNLIHSFNQSYHTSADDRILPLTSIASASFVGEILPLLCVGGTLVLPRENEFLDLEILFDLAARHRVSIISTVPAMIASLNARKGDLPPLRLLLSGGEALTTADIDHLQGSVTIVNSYGLTETTICSTFYSLDGHDVYPGSGVPIGGPVTNTDVYVLDADLNCLPIGCLGELYVAGVGLARGYLANPKLTAERFLPDPFRPGERMYRTGDLARWLPDGVLEFLNRRDYQVKIRGFRIELGEIEAMLKQHPALRDAVVVAREVAQGDRRLVAYVAPTEPAADVGDLYQWLSDKLPPHMVPAAFEVMAALPLTPNGKVDIRALPAPEGLRPSLATAYVAPQSQVERTIAAIWQSILKVEQVGIHDNFFELGGNSLLIAQVHHRLRQDLNGDLSLVDMFKYPTINALAQHISRKQPATSSLGEVKEQAQKRKEALHRREQLAKQRLRAP